MIKFVVARIEVLKRFDEKHDHDKRHQFVEFDNTMRVSDEDFIRHFIKMLKVVLTRISILKKRRDICYQYVFKVANEKECLIRECDVKSSSSKNIIRHFKMTIIFEHEIAVIILQQTDCLQCERQ